MTKKIVTVILIIVLLSVLGIVAINVKKDNKKVDDKKETINEDAQKFKKEYESLNDQVNESNGKKYRSVEIKEDNPFIYKSADELADMIKEKETFIVYFGFKSCPWCRSVITTLIDVADELDIDKVYYVDVKDIRDTIEINKDGKIETTKKGSDGYYRLINLLDNVLEEYTLTNEDGKEVSAEEKRIYAPNIVAVVKGKAVDLTTGISSEQTDGYMELTDKMLDDTKNKITKVLSRIQNLACDSQSAC